jgi:Protein of unknown function (DUF1403)
MRSAADSSEKVAPPRPLPTWARPNGARFAAENIGFLAGAALMSLDTVVRSDPPFVGVWRHRLALRAAAATVRMMGRPEEEPELRDAWHLRSPGRALGPAGRHLEAWRALVGRTTLSRDALKQIAASFDLGSATPIDEIFALTAGADQGANPLKAAAQTAAAIYKFYPAAELLALWAADFVLAEKLRWPRPLPLLALHLAEPVVRRAADVRTSRPDDEGWERLVAVVYAKGAATAVDLAGELHRRAEQLLTHASKLRARGAQSVVATLLADDAIAPAARIGGMSDRAMRRLADRLVALGAARELTHRATFRLYGL